MKKITLKAYAKINLALDILGKRKDGYHEVEMIMQGINLHDLVEIENINEGITLRCSDANLETGSANLAYQAAELLKTNYRNISGVRICLHKRIPVAAGLAGGSTDAAAVLLGMNEMFQIGLTLVELEELAAELGSDVPFCLNPVTALAKGRGEAVTEITPCPRLWLVLVKPFFDASTKEVYNHLQNVTVVNRPDVKEVVHAIKEQEVQVLLKAMGNVLEYSTFDLYPQLREYRNEMMAAGAKRVIMSGSGPTLLGFLPDEPSAYKMAAAIKRSGWRVFACRTLNREDLKGRVI